MSYCRRTRPDLSITHHLAVLFRLFGLQAVLEELKYKAASSSIYQTYKIVKVDFNYSMRHVERNHSTKTITSSSVNSLKFRTFPRERERYQPLLTILLSSNSHRANYVYGNIHKSILRTRLQPIICSTSVEKYPFKGEDEQSQKNCWLQMSRNIDYLIGDVNVTSS